MESVYGKNFALIQDIKEWFKQLETIKGPADGEIAG